MQTILRDQRIPDCLGAQKDSSVDLTSDSVTPESHADAESPRFAMTYCSECGEEQGPGDEGVSHCSDHRRNPDEHLALVDAVNDAKTKVMRDIAYWTLVGWRQGYEHAGRRVDLMGADWHTMSRFGEDRPMCCGVLLDWKPEDQQ